MRYGIFVQELGAALQLKLGEEYVVSSETVTKGNDQPKEALAVGYRKGCVKMAIYPEQEYQRYLKNGNMEECVESIMAIIRQEQTNTKEMKDRMLSAMNWQDIKDQIRPRLLAKATNTEYLKGCVTKDYLEFMICYCIHLPGFEQGLMSCRVTWELLKRWEITEQELDKAAMINMEQDGYGIMSMEEILIENGVEPIALPEGESLYVYSNEQRMYGAAAILITEPLKELAERIQRNLLLLIPSSVHEWIIFPEGKEEIDTINWMIQGINQNEVSPEERLADHAFYYDREKDEIRIAE